jgi:hypothetical protein
MEEKPLAALKNERGDRAMEEHLMCESQILTLKRKPHVMKEIARREPGRTAEKTL